MRFNRRPINLMKAALWSGLMALVVLGASNRPALSEDGHEWLQAHKAEVKGAIALLAGARLCHLRSSEWSKRMESRLGLYIGNHTSDEDNDEINGMSKDAQETAIKAYTAGGKDFCEDAVKPRLPSVEATLNGVQ